MKVLPYLCVLNQSIMAKTLNKDIDTYNSEDSAKKAFDKATTPCHLLHSKPYKAWYIDRSKTALAAWPTSYTLLGEK